MDVLAVSGTGEVADWIPRKADGRVALFWMMGSEGLRELRDW